MLSVKMAILSVMPVTAMVLYTGDHSPQKQHREPAVTGECVVQQQVPESLCLL